MVEHGLERVAGGVLQDDVRETRAVDEGVEDGLEEILGGVVQGVGDDEAVPAEEGARVGLDLVLGLAREGDENGVFAGFGGGVVAAVVAVGVRERGGVRAGAWRIEGRGIGWWSGHPSVVVVIVLVAAVVRKRGEDGARGWKIGKNGQG